MASEQGECERRAEAVARAHLICEDGWYSCPKSSEGCANDADGTDCTCGRDSEVGRIAAALRDVAREAAEIAEEGYCGELTAAAIRERFGLTTTPNDKENSQ